MRRVGRHLLAAVRGLVFVLLVVELGLRVAAFFAGRAARERFRSEDPEGRPVVAFVGDSTIYGVYVEADETLPKALERLSRRDGARGVTCVNLGVPGAASWNGVEQMQRALVLRPRAVVVRVGANNYRAAPPGEKLGAIERLRIVRVIRFALFNWRVREMQKARGVQTMQIGPRGEAVEVGVATGCASSANLIKPRDGEAAAFEMTFRSTAAFAEIAPRLEADLSEMARLARQAGAALLIATYLPGLDEPYAATRELALSLKDRLGIAVADTAVVLPRAIQGNDPQPTTSWTSERLQAKRSLFLFRDWHPTALGYEIEARVVARTLHEIGVLPDVPLEDPLAAVVAVDVAVPAMRQVADAPVTFEIRTMPNDHVILLLGSPGGTSTWNGVGFPFDWRRVLDEELVASMTTEADATGKARIELPPAVRRRLEGTVRAAGLIERGGRGMAAQTLLTPVIEVDLGS